MTSATATLIKKSAKAGKIDSVFECPRCNGKGHLPEFRHVKNGVCFLCAGEKTISLKKRYPKKDAIVCTVLKGMCSQYTDNTFTKLEYVYREAINISFDGGVTVLFAKLIDDSNRSEMRAVWKWAKDNGATMILEEKDLPRY